MPKETTKDWVSVQEASRQLGISPGELKAYIHNGTIPFNRVGSRYRLNVKLVRAVMCRLDIQNMEQVRRNAAQLPMHTLNRSDTVRGTGNHGKREQRKIPRVEDM